MLVFHKSIFLGSYDRKQTLVLASHWAIL